ncbi:MAG: TadE/TadG family type IV pilus assembly protein [Bryobacteraceae bacterium]
MLESALILTVFIGMLVAIYDVSHFLILHQSLTERVRDALRYGTVHPFDATKIQNIVLYGSPAEPSGAAPSFNLTRSMVNVQRLDPDSTEDRIVVTVSGYPFEILTPWIARIARGVAISNSLPYEQY